MKEQILFGVRKGDEAWQEQVLCTQPERFEADTGVIAQDKRGLIFIADLYALKVPSNLLPDR